MRRVPHAPRPMRHPTAPRCDRRRRRTPPRCHRSHAAAPPTGGVIGQSSVRCGPDAQDGLRAAHGRPADRRGRRRRADQIDRAGQRVRVDHDLDEVVVLNHSDRAVVQRLGTDVTDAGAAREPGEPAVGDECHVLAPGQVAERRGDLGGLLHAGSRRPHADQERSRHLRARVWLDVPLTASIAVLTCEHTRRTAMAIDPSAPITERSIAVALITEPCGARLPRGNTTVLVSPA